MIKAHGNQIIILEQQFQRNTNTGLKTMFCIVFISRFVIQGRIIGSFVNVLYICNEKKEQQSDLSSLRTYELRQYLFKCDLCL